MKKNILMLMLMLSISILIVSGCGGSGGGNGSNDESKAWTSEEINAKVGAFNSTSTANDKSKNKNQSEVGTSASTASSFFINTNFVSSSEGEYLSRYEWSGPDAEGWYTAATPNPNYSLKFKSVNSNTYKFVDSLTYSTETTHEKGWIKTKGSHSSEFTMTQDDSYNWHGISKSIYFDQVIGHYADGVNVQDWDNTNKGESTLQVIGAKMDESNCTYIADDLLTQIDINGNEETHKIHNEYTISLNGNTYNLSGTTQVDTNPADSWNESWPKN